ncbi:MAG: GH92 family glycosyl hydrolase [Marinilabiliales bacterium]|nr:GH92 family glycosyl hydrolase [Marinilabiliales bacterium]
MKISLLLFLLLGGFALQAQTTQNNPVDFVNPLMGSDSNYALSTGNTYPAVALPWGMNFWTPQTGKMGNGWIYSYDATHIQGIKQTHEPSPWINDYGQFSLFAETGDLILDGEKRASWFSHKAEISKPYYYSVYLADYDVKAEVTPTERAAILRFTFPEGKKSYLLVDAFDKGSFVRIDKSKKRITGYSTRNSGGVASNFKNYFVIELDKPIAEAMVWSDTTVVSGAEELKANHAGAALRFETSKGEQIHARVASSFISEEQALINLQELGTDSFEAVCHKGREIWNKGLSVIEAEGGSEDQLKTFYSCLYRTMLFPRKFYELDKQGKVWHYSPYEGKVLPGYLFTDNGYWDTFRAVFPLFNLLHPSLNARIQEGMVNTFQESGWLPEWASPGHRNCMIGSNSASIIADAYLKGARGYDIEKLWDAVVKNSENEGPLTSVGRKGVDWYNKLGYVPYDVKINESAARTLEYAYDDWCILQLGKALNKPQAELDRFAKRSLNYKNLFDPSTKLMRGKNQDGSFQRPFSPFKWGDAFTEGNSWHYTWSVFHDVNGLANLMGGKKELVRMLDSVFVVPPVFDASYYGQVIHEIREMQIANMGNYAHGNQPIQHMIYLYNFGGEPWKAQYWVRETLNRMYSPTPDGYCGDEDNGQTSAWYIFSAMGFYPVCPGADQYVLGAPLFKKITIHLENGKKVVLDAPDNSVNNRYIRSMTWDGKPYTKNWLSYSELMKGATFRIQMADKPDYKRGTEPADAPYSLSNEK